MTFLSPFFIIKVRAVMGIDFKMIKIHEIVSDSGEICKMSSGNFQKLLSYGNYFIVKKYGN